MNEIEQVVQDSLDRDVLPSNVARPNGSSGRIPSSVAEQVLAVAATIKSIHQDIDRLQTELITRLDELRKRLGSRA